MKMLSPIPETQIKNCTIFDTNQVVFTCFVVRIKESEKCECQNWVCSLYENIC